MRNKTYAECCQLMSEYEVERLIGTFRRELVLCEFLIFLNIGILV